MSATTSAATGRCFGIQRVCQVWERSRSALYARRARAHHHRCLRRSLLIGRLHPRDRGGNEESRPRATTVENRASTSWAMARLRRSRADDGGTDAQCAGERSARTRGLPTAGFAARDGSSTKSSNPMSWMIAVGGIIVDVRTMPPEVQAEAWRRGLIPDHPARPGDE